jgi:hypothetical protein
MQKPVYSGFGRRERFPPYPSTSSLPLKTRKGKVPNQVVRVYPGPSFKGSGSRRLLLHPPVPSIL